MMLSTVSRNPCPTTMAGTERRVSTTTLRRIGRLLGLGAGLMCAARVAAARRAADAFRRIAAAAGPFVSRGDSSATHVKELALWDAAGVRPPAAGGWYLQAGADQATTLHVADERNAYALADLPTLA